MGTGATAPSFVCEGAEPGRGNSRRRGTATTGAGPVFLPQRPVAPREHRAEQTVGDGGQRREERLKARPADVQPNALVVEALIVVFFQIFVRDAVVVEPARRCVDLLLFGGRRGAVTARRAEVVWAGAPGSVGGCFVLVAIHGCGSNESAQARVTPKCSAGLNAVVSN